MSERATAPGIAWREVQLLGIPGEVAAAAAEAGLEPVEQGV